MLFDKYVYIQDNKIDPEIIAKLIKFLNFAYEKKWYREGQIFTNQSAASLIKEIRNVETMGLTNLHESLTLSHWANLVTYYLSISINNYCRVHKDVPEASINDIQALRYEKGGHYKLHIDDGGNTYRRISQILYLNNDYEGGNLIFESTDGKDKKVVEPKAGRIITWPSNYVFGHGVEPITKGVRHSIVSWAV